MSALTGKYLQQIFRLDFSWKITAAGLLWALQTNWEKTGFVFLLNYNWTR